MGWGAVYTRALMISALALAVIPALLLPWVLLPLKQPLPFILIPVLPVAAVYVRAVAARDGTRAITVALAWAVAWSAATIAAATLRPDAAVRGIWHAGAFRDEMVRWIATGAGPEGNIRLFLPRVLAEFALVLALPITPPTGRWPPRAPSPPARGPVRPC